MKEPLQVGRRAKERQLNPLDRQLLNQLTCLKAFPVYVGKQRVFAQDTNTHGDHCACKGHSDHETRKGKVLDQGNEERTSGMCCCS